MKIKIDRDYTTKKQENFVKIAIDDFKRRFTEEDLKMMFFNAFDLDVSGEILKTDVNAFASNWMNENTSFRIEMVLMTSCKFIRFSFYLDEVEHNYTPNTDVFLRCYEVYRLSDKG